MNDAERDALLRKWAPVEPDLETLAPIAQRFNSALDRLKAAYGPSDEPPVPQLPPTEREGRPPTAQAPRGATRRSTA